MSLPAQQLQQPPYVKHPRPRRILVIGGGVAGLAALNALVAENGVKGTRGTNGSQSDSPSPFDQIELIERRANIGGVWYLDEATVAYEKSLTLGTANDQWPVQDPSQRKPFWPSPAYPMLRGNVLPPFLTFSDCPFPPPSSSKEAFDARQQLQNGQSPKENGTSSHEQVHDPYPTLSETQAYLEQVAKPLRGNIRCNVECIGVWELPCAQDASQNRWAVRIRDWNKEGKERTEFWDAVVVSVGWTDVPVYPNVSGLAEARKAGLVDHCKWYRGPEPYGADERVVVVGNSISANDVCVHLAARRTPGVHEPVLRICRHKAFNFAVSLADPMIRDVPALHQIELIPTTDGKRPTANLHLIDGQIVKNVDRIIIATGYQIAKFPFVHILDRPLEAHELQELGRVPEQSDAADWQPAEKLASAWRSISSPAHGTQFERGTNPERVSGLYNDFLHARAATLALINLPVSSVPFWLSNVQGHCIRVIWDGSFTLPEQLKERLTYEHQRLAYIRKLHEKKEENERTAEEAHRARLLELQEQRQTTITNGDINTNGNGKHPLTVAADYEAPDHTEYVNNYHVIGTVVADYLITLRSIVVQAKPSWSKRLPDFENVRSTYEGMYDVKRSTLQAKRNAGIR